MRPPTTEPQPHTDDGVVTSAHVLTSWRARGRRVMRVGKYAMGHSAWTLPVLFRLTPEGTSRAINDRTLMAVEGFPRSGNTYTTFALKALAERDVHIASHAHHPGHVKHAVARGMPTLVVVRPPVETLASYLIGGPHGTPRMVLYEYRYYYRAIEGLADSITIATFDQVTKDLAGVASRLNDRYGLDLEERTPVGAEQDSIFRQIDDHFDKVHRPAERGLLARPDSVRNEVNMAWREQLQAPQHARCLADCREVYERLAQRSLD